MSKISEGEIKEKLMKHYGPTMDRELKKYKHNDNHEGLGTIFYSLNGSPPKGYAIYVRSLRLLSFYDVQGKRFRKMTSTSIEEVKE